MKRTEHKNRRKKAMKNHKQRIEKIEEKKRPKRLIKVEIISHIPNFPSQTFFIPAGKGKR
jgi:hypothetical protein